LASGGLLLASLFPVGRLTATGLRLLGIGLGSSVVASQIPDLMLLDLAAQAGRGGAGKLTSQNPEEARLNLIMGYTNLVLAGLDLGLEVGLVQRLTQVPELLSAAATLTREQSRVLVNSIARHTENLSDGMLARLVEEVRTADARTTLIVMNSDGSLTQMRPLEGVTEKLESTTAARASGNAAKASKAIQVGEELSDEAAEELLAKYPQWNNVKDFVGKHLDLNNLPPGYKYRVKNGQPELYRDSTEGPFPPLTVKNGVVELQTGQSSRLSVFSRYKKNYLDWVEETQGKAARVAAQKRLDAGNQLHHLTPDAVVRENLLTQELMRRSKTYTLDRGTNILDMPTVHDPKTGEIVHLGSHPGFNKYVDGLLNLEIGNLTGDGAIPLEKVKMEDIDKALRQVEDLLRDQIINRTLPKNVLKELEGGGFGISEGFKDSQRGEIV
jgi:hypothetical protein